jgi:F-type H+/Na+-transporting ATPase subunit alpha
MISKDVLANIKKELNLVDEMPELINYGRVEKIIDGVIILNGLTKAKLLEKIYCEEKNIYAVILNLAETEIGALVLGDFSKLKEKDVFKSTGEILDVSASELMMGRVIDALGVPIDGSEPIPQQKVKIMPLEKVAPGVTDREPVKKPLHTGITAIDTMIPIGKGQRELIIGDRGTGKTAIAIDAILNQKQAEEPVVCIYVAIGQKSSKVLQLKEVLLANGAMEYTVIINASSSDPVAMQYIAPYTGTAIAEYFMSLGKDVLIIYDDLTKHAWAYRQISLTLRRPPGREAYPGDIFYLHSRLLERSCKLSHENGGGSISSLPIVETQFGDVSSYIPTNIISITDGQIYLDADLFNSGIRPAVDVSNSVSRVGSSAQIKEMKQTAGPLRLNIATYKELESFSQFGSGDLDQETKNKLNRGRLTIEILKQSQYNPIKMITQIALVKALNEGLFDGIDIKDIENIKTRFIDYMDNHQNLDDIGQSVERFFETINK